MNRLFASALLLGLIAAPYEARANCDSSIITAIDVSGSIDAQETALQIDGVAEAISSESVIAAIQSGEHGCINFLVFLWADGEYPAIVDWTVIASREDAEAVAAKIMAALQGITEGMADNNKRNWGTLTNLSGAINHATEALNGAPPAERIVLNVIGNGEDNVGEDPLRARTAFIALGATINGVVVGGDPAVLNYYRNQVIGGKFARVWVAATAADVAYTFTLKFSAEIAQR